MLFIYNYWEMESIFTKSMMKLNPNGKELVDLLSFVPLL